MKIAVTVSVFMQVSQEQYRDVPITKVFDSSQSIDEMLEWAKTIDERVDFHSLTFSEVRP